MSRSEKCDIRSLVIRREERKTSKKKVPTTPFPYTHSPKFFRREEEKRRKEKSADALR